MIFLTLIMLESLIFLDLPFNSRMCINPFSGFECRCGNVYCGVHRYSDVHNCSYNYKADAAEKIRKENPVVVGEKIQKIWTPGIQNPLTICKLKIDLRFFFLVIGNVEQCILHRPFNHACHQKNRFLFLFWKWLWTFIYIAVSVAEKT